VLKERLQPIAYSSMKESSQGYWQPGVLGGVDYRSDTTAIPDSKSPNMVNMICDVYGGLAKRPGWGRLFTDSLGTDAVSAMCWFSKVPGIVFLCDKALYFWQKGTAAGTPPTLLHTFSAAGTRTIFEYLEKIYVLGAGDFYCYDGSTLTDMLNEPYEPTLRQSVPPLSANPDDPLGTEKESMNLLCQSYKILASPATGNSNVFTLPDKASSISWVKYNGTVVASANYSLDATGLEVTLTESVAAGENTVEICVLRDDWSSNGAEQIANCTIAKLYGGHNDTRVFVSGNSAKPNTDWYSALYDPSYFPASGYTNIGDSSDAIKGYGVQYDTMIIFKERSAWLRSYTTSSTVGNATAYFPVQPLHDSIGCLAANSLQTVENSPVFLSKSGIYTLAGSSLRDERNMKHISDAIDPHLLAESNLGKAISFDWQNLYGLALNGNCYVYDYQRDEWFFWQALPFGCALVAEGRLYFGHSEAGLLGVMRLDADDDLYSDDGEAISASWQSKDTDLGHYGWEKTVRKFYITLRPDVPNNSASVNIASERGEKRELVDCRLHLLSFEKVDFGDFSFLTANLPRVYSRRLRLPRLHYCRLTIANNTLNQGLSFSGLALGYSLWGIMK